MIPPATTVPTATPPQPADEWQRHEHVAPPAQVAAQRLVETTGSVELAKQAVEQAGEPSRDSSGGRDEFANRHGFASYLEMFESAEPVLDPHRAVWLVVASGPQFFAWSEREFTALRFDSRDQALAAIQRGSLGAGGRPAE